jgi:hypothetical protein
MAPRRTYSSRRNVRRLRTASTAASSARATCLRGVGGSLLDDRGTKHFVVISFNLAQIVVIPFNLAYTVTFVSLVEREGERWLGRV